MRISSLVQIPHEQTGARRRAKPEGHSVAFSFQFSFQALFPRVLSSPVIGDHWHQRPDERERNPVNPKLDQIEQKIKNVQDSMSRMNSMVKIFVSEPPISAVHQWQGVDGRTPDAASNGTRESRS